ncbi:MAG TPA: DedA family protein [Candidatus Methylomirabilis sp.]|nr:DedA family protein [Candidatus Methylomirabilis sp.]
MDLFYKILVLLSTLVIWTISTLGYTGIVVAMAIESACIPLPSEVIMPFSGYLVSQGRFTLWGVSLAGALGCMLGSAVAYAAGAYGGRPFLLKYGRYFLITAHEMDRADHWFARYGMAATFISRLLPVIRTFISLPAGIARVPFTRFLFYAFLGSLPWSWVLAYAGLLLGEHWDQVGGWLHSLDVVIVIGLAAGMAWFVWRHWPRRVLGPKSGR